MVDALAECTCFPARIGVHMRSMESSQVLRGRARAGVAMVGRLSGCATWVRWVGSPSSKEVQSAGERGHVEGYSPLSVVVRSSAQPLRKHARCASNSSAPDSAAPSDFGQLLSPRRPGLRDLPISLISSRISQKRALSSKNRRSGFSHNHSYFYSTAFG